MKMNALSGASTIITVTKIVNSSVSNDKKRINEDNEKKNEDNILLPNVMDKYAKKTSIQKQPNGNLATSKSSLPNILLLGSTSPPKPQIPVSLLNFSSKTLENSLCKKTDSSNVLKPETTLTSLSKNVSLKQSSKSQENEFCNFSDKNLRIRQHSKLTVGSIHTPKSLNQGSLENFQISNNILKSINSKQSSKNVLPPFDKYFFSPSKESPLKVHQFKQRKRLLNRRSVGQSSLSSKSSLIKACTSVKSSYINTPKQINGINKNYTQLEPETKKVIDKNNLNIVNNNQSTETNKNGDGPNETLISNDLANSHGSNSESELKGGSIMFFNNMFKKDSETKKNYSLNIEGKSVRGLNNIKNDKKEQKNTPCNATIVDNSIKISEKAIENLQNNAISNFKKISEIAENNKLIEKTDKILITETSENSQNVLESKDVEDDFKLFEDEESNKEVKKSKKRGRPRTRNVGINAGKNDVVVKTKKSILNDEEITYNSKILEKEERCYRIETRLSRKKIKKKCSCEDSRFPHHHYHSEDDNDAINTDDDFELSLKCISNNESVSSDSDESMNEITKAISIPSPLQEPMKEIKTHKKICKRGNQEAVNDYIKFLPTSHTFPIITEEDVEFFKIAHNFYLQHKNGIIDILKNDEEKCPSENTEALDNDYEDTVSNVSSCAPPKRKRGRPKKVNNQNNAKSNMKGSYKESEKLEKNAPNTENIDTAAVKRKRGRPKKTIAVDDNNYENKSYNISNPNSVSNYQKKNYDSDISITDDNYDSNLSNNVFSTHLENSSATIDRISNGQMIDSDRSESFKEKNPPIVKKQRLISSMLKELEDKKSANEINVTNNEINSKHEVINENQKSEKGFGFLSKEPLLSFESLTHISKPVSTAASSFLPTSTSLSHFQSFPSNFSNSPSSSSPLSSSFFCFNSQSYLPSSFKSFRGCGTAFAQSFTSSSLSASSNFQFSTSFATKNNLKDKLFKTNNLTSFSFLNNSTQLSLSKPPVSRSIEEISCNKNVSISSHSTFNRCSCKHYCGLNGPLSPLQHQRSMPFQNTLLTEHLSNFSTNDYETHSNNSFQLQNKQSFVPTSKSMQLSNNSLSCQQLLQQTSQRPLQQQQPQHQAQHQLQQSALQQQFQQPPQQVLLIQAPQLLSLVQHLLQQKQPNVSAPNFQNILDSELFQDTTSVEESYQPQTNLNVSQQMNLQENIVVSSEYNSDSKQPSFQPQNTSTSNILKTTTASQSFNNVSNNTNNEVLSNVTNQGENINITLNNQNDEECNVQSNTKGKSICSINGSNHNKISQVKLLEFLKDTLKDNTFASVGSDLTSMI